MRCLHRSYLLLEVIRAVVQIRGRRKKSPYNIALEPELTKIVKELSVTYPNAEPKIIYGCFEHSVAPFGGLQTFRYSTKKKGIAVVEMGKRALFDKIDYEYMEPTIDAAIGRINEVVNDTENPVSFSYWTFLGSLVIDEISDTSSF